MGSLRYVRQGCRTSLLLVLLLLLTSWSALLGPDLERPSPLEESNYDFSVSSRSSQGRVDVPSWRIGDSWTYDGYFDVGALVAGAGGASNVQTLTGDLSLQVADIVTMIVENESTLVYRVTSSGLFEANGVTLSGYTGDLDVDYDATDYIRASDLATVRITQHMVVEFSTFGGLITIDVADITIDNFYGPPKENHDFPLRVGDSWTNNYTQTTNWAGSSDYFTLPSNSVTQESSDHRVVSHGNPAVPYGSGCANSYNITAFDANGSVTDFHWWCPNVNNEAWRHFQDGIGLIIDFKLKTYTPVSRSLNLLVDLAYPAWPLDTNLSAWVNVTDGSGNPVSGQTVEFRYENMPHTLLLTTPSNGSVHTIFDTGHNPDPSDSPDDFASHGVLAWVSSGKRIGANTIVLDDDLVALDYLPRSQGVSVERTRGNDTVVLNSVTGYNAIPGDMLMFSVPVQNRGLLSGPATELEVTAPDGTTSRANVPALGPQQETWVDVSWNVPGRSQGVGDVTLSFTVDPDDLMTNDDNQSNDVGTFSLFIGRLPTADLVQPPATRTLAEVVLDARGSVDPDGGSPVCTFQLEGNSWLNETFTDVDCLMSYTWDDDGVYKVWLTVTDDENDQDSLSLDVTILNRAPWVNITSPENAIPVESTITVDAYDSGDLDTQTPEAPISILWERDCAEGRVTLTCTLTPMEEGIYPIRLTAEDDDGDVTPAEFNLIVRNIAPSQALITASSGGEELVADSQMRWHVLEDQLVTLHGAAHDSVNDIDSLSWGWQPDLELDPNLFLETTGPTSTIEVDWDEAGTHVIAMEVVDDDGATSGVVNAWVEVQNVAPTVGEITRPFPVGEDMDATLTGTYSDTESDLEGLRVCWDVDFGVDLDENGDSMDDCDVLGADFRWAWPNKGIHTVRFHVTDDDGEQNSTLVDIEVVNKKPRAHAEAERLELKVGEELIIWTNNTTDSQSDIAGLIYTWDLDYTHDADDDGDPANDLDYDGTPFRRSFNTAGTKYIRLTVSDEEFSDTFDIEVIVTEDNSGALGWLRQNSAGVSFPVIILGLILAVLLMVLAFTMLRKPKVHRADDDWRESLGISVIPERLPTMSPPNYAFGDGDPHAPQVAPVESAPQYVAPAPAAEEQPAAQPYDPNALSGAMDLFGDSATTQSQSAPAPAPVQPAPAADQPPPVPAGGIPPGWTEEQWNHYGREWLEQQSQEQSGLDTGLDLDL